MSYEAGWHDYLTPFDAPASVAEDGGLLTQYDVALMVLEAHDDKTFPGASVASLTDCWGDVINADQCCASGYHHVWARDLYQIATARWRPGTRPPPTGRSTSCSRGSRSRCRCWTGGAALERGAFPRFSTVDGVTDRGCCEQLDEDAFPIVLAWQLGRANATTWEEAEARRRPHPRGGAGHAAGALGGAARLLPFDHRGGGRRPRLRRGHRAEERDSARAQAYLAKADEWQQKVETWTFTTSGSFGDHSYYERIDHNGDPNDLFQRKFLGQAGDDLFWEKDVVDAGFLELVRLGVKPADDPKVAQSLPVVDGELKVRTPPGACSTATTHGYGENEARQGDQLPGDKGRLWPILSGERGEYELANGRTGHGRAADHGRGGERRVPDPRAGLGRGRPVRLHARQGHRLGDAARLVDGGVRPVGACRSTQAGQSRRRRS